MKRLPVELSALLHEVQVRLPALLKENLVGIYLHGSVTQRSFNSNRSDVDVIVVSRRDLGDAQFRKVGNWLGKLADSNSWTKRLQMLFLIEAEVLKMNSRACLYQFGLFKRSGSDGNPIVWMDVLKSGMVLYGAHAESFVPAITPQILFQALEREVDYLRDEIGEKPHSEWRNVPSYRAYAVLTLCRILYSFRNRTIVSKQRAGQWAIKHVPSEYREIILRALGSDGGTSRQRISLARIKQLINFVENQIHGAKSSH